MATMFDRFEVQSELCRSETALIYKALDSKTNLLVALKVQDLEPLGDRADAFVNTLIVEGESTRDLVCQNIGLLYGAGEIDGQFCAAMEYIQGNSVATMLARKEGFSIWDLLDITRQVCTGLECADSKGVVHCSLEPAKIMVQWDGMVKILGYGISNMSLIEAESGRNLGRLMPYCSPEQIRGESIDLRSNLFTLGAILYEMVAGQKAFDAADPVALLNQIENEMPVAPCALNPKIQPGVSVLIMKALSKDPLQRFQSARELLYSLEECKESGKKSTSDSSKAVPGSEVVANSAVRSRQPGKFASATAPKAAVAPASVAPSPVLASSSSTAPMARAAAAGASANGTARADSGLARNQGGRSPVMSAAAAEPEVVQSSPRVAVDPLMAAAAGSAGPSFSDLAEMPPLQAPLIISAPDPEPVELFPEVLQLEKKEKPRKQPREVAQIAFHHVATLPPRLLLYAISGAVFIILVLAIAIFVHVRLEDSEATAPPRSEGQAASATVAPLASPAVAPPIVDAQPTLKVRQIKRAGSAGGRKVSAPPPAPVIIPSEAMIESTPAGAQFEVDGKSDPAWITPFSLIGLSPGRHIISASKPGYSSEIRSIEVFAATKSSLAFHLSPSNAAMVLSSFPAGAEVILDGKSTGRTTPTQFSVEKGRHTVLLRKAGYLDQTITADLIPAQNFQYSPDLRALGDTSDMRTVGKLGKLFGRGGEPAGMGSVSVRTQPKGAQIAINQRVLDKTSPVDVALGPGNYIVDITLTGFKPVHKVIVVDSGGKAAISEVLERQ